MRKAEDNGQTERGMMRCCLEHSSPSTIHLLLFICWLLHRVTSPPEGGEGREGAPSPMFTVTYPLILQHPPCTLYFSTAEWKVEGAQCLHAVREDWGCPVPQRQSPEVGDHMCSHYPCWRDFNYRLLLILSTITPMPRIPLKYWGAKFERGMVEKRQIEGTHVPSLVDGYTVVARL